MSKPRLLFCASEVYPFAKSGGLADVAHSLPRALCSAYAVEVVLPLYQCIDREAFGIEPLGKEYVLQMGGISYPVMLYGCTYEGVAYRFIYSPLLCDRTFLYGPPDSGYEDNALRYGLFSYAVVTLLKKEAYSIVHLNDWQSALIALLIKEETTIKTKSVFTIHNLAYQGVFAHQALLELGLDERYFSMESMEFYGQINFMKAGIAYADRITTVSPTYAKEILTPEFGCGLEGFLHFHRHKLSGIVNGIDTKHFSPSQDKTLVFPYVDLRGKAVNKRAYLKQTALKEAKKPLFIFVGRFASQKGLDLLIEILPDLVKRECTIAFLGEGESKYHQALEALAKTYDTVHVTCGYDEALSHQMYAAADFFLMPSLFEPCGLAQMIAMRYGVLPIVHHVGGLADTVQDYTSFTAQSAKGYGVVFSQPKAETFLAALDDALALYTNKRRYNKVAKHNMRCDFSWQESAKSYLEIYETLRKENSHA